MKQSTLEKGNEILKEIGIVQESIAGLNPLRNLYFKNGEDFVSISRSSESEDFIKKYLNSKGQTLVHLKETIISLNDENEESLRKDVNGNYYYMTAEQLEAERIERRKVLAKWASENKSVQKPLESIKQ